MTVPLETSFQPMRCKRNCNTAKKLIMFKCLLVLHVLLENLNVNVDIL